MGGPFSPGFTVWSVTVLSTVAMCTSIRADDGPTASPSTEAASTTDDGPGSGSLGPKQSPPDTPDVDEPVPVEKGGDEPAIGTPGDVESKPPDSPPLAVEEADGKLIVTCGGEPVTTYVYSDEAILRPYFTNVFAPAGERVTRHHPPREGVELTDHETMHPGVWLGFGDLSGADFWRNKAKVQHVEFTEPPKVEDGVLSFTVRNRYVSGEKAICDAVVTHTLRRLHDGWLLTYDCSFSGEQPFTFGDQEEMGLGIRVAAPLRVRGGAGRIVNAEGLENEAGVWGKASDYVSYEGVVDGRRLGVLLVPHPENFRKSWFHARDYGFVAANPFGRKAFGAGEPSRVAVQPGETFRLRFGLLVYSTPEDEPLDAKLGAKQYVDVTGKVETEPVHATDPEAN